VIQIRIFRFWINFCSFAFPSMFLYHLSLSTPPTGLQVSSRNMKLMAAMKNSLWELGGSYMTATKPEICAFHVVGTWVVSGGAISRPCQQSPGGRVGQISGIDIREYIADRMT